jgi:hypothetical protein
VPESNPGQVAGVDACDPDVGLRRPSVAPTPVGQLRGACRASQGQSRTPPRSARAVRLTPSFVWLPGSWTLRWSSGVGWKSQEAWRGSTSPTRRSTSARCRWAARTSGPPRTSSSRSQGVTDAAEVPALAVSRRCWGQRQRGMTDERGPTIHAWCLRTARDIRVAFGAEVPARASRRSDPHPRQAGASGSRPHPRGVATAAQEHVNPRSPRWPGQDGIVEHPTLARPRANRLQAEHGVRVLVATNPSAPGGPLVVACQGGSAKSSLGHWPFDAARAEMLFTSIERVLDGHGTVVLSSEGSRQALGAGCDRVGGRAPVSCTPGVTGFSSIGRHVRTLLLAVRHLIASDAVRRLA